MNEPEIIKVMLRKQSIAVVGLSADPAKASHYVSAYMQAQGFTVYPVNPSVENVLGQKSYATLADLPIKPDVVNVFRLPTFIPAIVDEMQELGLTHLWVQQGIVNKAAAKTAEDGGIHVVMDRCIMVEHRKWEGS